MSIVFKRYDVYGERGHRTTEVPDAEGEYVKAQDAYDKCAVLSAEIATLKAQLKEAETRHAQYRTAMFAFAYGAGPQSIEKMLRST